MLDEDVVDRDAELVRHDLGHGRLVSLAVGLVPVVRTTLPVRCTRTFADSHRPAPQPSPGSPIHFDGATPQTSMYELKADAEMLATSPRLALPPREVLVAGHLQRPCRAPARSCPNRSRVPVGCVAALKPARTGRRRAG